jgi:hypothetical protein
MTDLARTLRNLLSPGGLAHMVLYDRDSARIVVDVPGMEDEGHERAGRLLYYILEELEPDFADLRTGALIRTVLRVPSGAVFYYLIQSGIHLYAATHTGDRIDEVDEALADEVNSIRTSVNYSQLDFGSFLSRAAQGRAGHGSRAEATAPAAGPEQPEGPGEPTEPAAPARGERPGGRGAGDLGAHLHTVTGHVRTSDRTSEIIREALDLDGLHYLAYYSGSSAIHTADIFTHPDLGRYFLGPTPPARREKYGRLGRLLPGVVRRMNTSLGSVMRGELMQVVLDVEQGAAYYHVLRDGRFLVGVTLDQTRVAEADKEMTRVGRELMAV